MAKILKSSGLGKTSLNMSMILFDESIKMLNDAMFFMYIKTVLFQFLVFGKVELESKIHGTYFE
ncbi:hypothetical protein BK708_39930 [Bacillus thuringiensis serovar yunnanensis]|nr:hypothetical protein BK708_39930 [Bacillus thuringiensis serovar yunnanensis]